MKKDKSIEKFNEYLTKGLEILNNKDPKNKALLNRMRDHLDKVAKDKPDPSLFPAVFLALYEDEELSDNKLRDVTNSYDEVLGLITHEFKNILTSIHGYNMLLEKYLSPEKDKESYNHLLDSDRLTRQLFDMTDSLMKMSLGEKGLLKPELKLIDLIEDLLKPLLRDLENPLRLKKMKIQIKQHTKNLIVECDDGLLDIAIRNLLINAIKYGKQNSEITLGISRDKNKFSVSVKNICDEIPANLCDGIFEKFKSRKIGAEKGGTGIGLYNVKNIINLHQGNIICNCSVGKWVEFMFNIPQKLLSVDR